MTIKAQCDRCGALTEVSAQPVLPEDWREVKMWHPSVPAVVVQMRQLCPRCVTAFCQFFTGDGAVDGLLEPELLKVRVETAEERCARGVHLTTGSSPRCMLCGADPLWPTEDNVIPLFPVGLIPEEPEASPEKAVEAVNCMHCGNAYLRSRIREHTKEAHPEMYGDWQDQLSREPLPSLEPDPESAVEEEEHEHDFDRLHGLCRCGSSYGDVMARTQALNDPGPASFAGTDPAAPFGQRIPVGAKTAPCPNQGDGRCTGVYTRGELHAHMEAAHGVRVSSGSDACPYCPEICTLSLLGQHIAQKHPGDWQAWSDEKGRRGGS